MSGIEKEPLTPQITVFYTPHFSAKYVPKVLGASLIKKAGLPPPIYAPEGLGHLEEGVPSPDIDLFNKVAKGKQASLDFGRTLYKRLDTGGYSAALFSAVMSTECVVVGLDNHVANRAKDGAIRKSIYDLMRPIPTTEPQVIRIEHARREHEVLRLQEEREEEFANNLASTVVKGIPQNNTR
jgi:hypothetical protein